MMPNTPLEIASIERDAAWFWVDAMLFCQTNGIVFDESYIRARLTHIREMDPGDGIGSFNPSEWDFETTIRYPYIERAALEIIEKLQPKG
jgi:hypothetical protein